MLLHCSICYSTPLTRTKKDVNANRIKGLTQSVVDRSTPHVQWKREQIDYAYEARFAQILHALSSQCHFKIEQIDSKKANGEDKGIKYKYQNISQKMQKERYKTTAVTCLIPYGKLVKARNMDDLRIELLTRGVLVPADLVPDSVTERKQMLKQLEAERLMMECGVPEADALAHAEFKKMLDAPFKLSDD